MVKLDLLQLFSTVDGYIAGIYTCSSVIYSKQ